MPYSSEVLSILAAVEQVTVFEHDVCPLTVAQILHVPGVLVLPLDPPPVAAVAPLVALPLVVLPLVMVVLPPVAAAAPPAGGEGTGTGAGAPPPVLLLANATDTVTNERMVFMRLILMLKVCETSTRFDAM